jgi:hypothetical protein
MANQRGFVPCRKLGGGYAITRKYPVSAAANDAYFLGDAVIAAATGAVRTLKNASTGRPLGVIIGFEDQNGKPLTFNAPTRGPFLATAQAGYALVNCDPNQTYVVESGFNANDATIFAGAKVSAGTPNTLTGLSGQTLSGTVTTSADAQFQIIGLAPQQYVDNPRSSAATSAAAPALVEVIIVGHAYGTPV